MNEAHANRLFTIGFVFHVVDEETKPKGLHSNLFKVVVVACHAFRSSGHCNFDSLQALDDVLRR